MFFEGLKPATKNEYIFNVKCLQQCKVKFEPPKQKRNIVQCANCQRYGNTNPDASSAPAPIYNPMPPQGKIK
jgi:hypothetical protein